MESHFAKQGVSDGIKGAAAFGRSPPLMACADFLGFISGIGQYRIDCALAHTTHVIYMHEELTRIVYVEGRVDGWWVDDWDGLRKVGRERWGRNVE